MTHECIHVSGYACDSVFRPIYGAPNGIHCHYRCSLPHICDTCGRRSCYAVDSGNDENDDCEDWLAPCYYDEVDEDPEVEE